MTDDRAKIREALTEARGKIQDHINEIYSSGGVEYIGLGSTLNKIDKILASEDKPSECHWHCGDDDWGLWVGTCGVQYCLTEGTPTENEMAYCPKCGGKLIDDGYPKQEDEE